MERWRFAEPCPTTGRNMLRRILSELLVPASIIAVGLIAMFWLKSSNAPPDRSPPSPIPPFVETMVFQPSPSSFEIRVGGNVVPRREVTISAEISGVIVEKDDDLQGGRHVRKDTPLVQIAPEQYQLKVKELTSEIKQFSKDLRQVEVEAAGNLALIEVAERKLVLAKDEIVRLESLLARKSISQSDFDAAERTKLNVASELRLLKNDRDLIPIRRERLRVQLHLTRLRRQRAQLDLDRTKIVAPFDGTITLDAVEKGNFVQAGDVLVKIEETANVEIECNLRTDDLYWLWNSLQPQPPDGENADKSFFEVPDAVAMVTYSVAGQDFHWKGRLARYEGSGIAPKTRTVPCRVIVSEPKRDKAIDGPPALMRGMYVTVTLAVTPRSRLWKIPSRAVQPNGQVWTVKNNQLHVHTISPAKVLSDGVLIRAESTSLKPGSRMIVSQLSTAFDGMHVRQSSIEEDLP